MHQVLDNVCAGDWYAKTKVLPTVELPAVEMPADEEVLDLRRKVSKLAMQKQYFWQRCTESRDAQHLAEAEVVLLREALARAELAG
jgi:hypothetical protein